MNNIIWLIGVSICYFLFPAAFVITALPILYIELSSVYEKYLEKKDSFSLDLVTGSTILLCCVVIIMVMRMMIILGLSDNPKLILLFFVTVLPLLLFKLLSLVRNHTSHSK